jgi:hypothetical protein
MKTSLLLVTTDPRSVAAARMPRSLAEAGFDVSLLAPANALAQKSGYIARVGHFPESGTTREWIYAFAAMVRGCSPRLVVPGDDTTVRLMQMLVLAPPAEMNPEIRAQLAAMVQESLGEPTGYEPDLVKLAASVTPATADEGPAVQHADAKRVSYSAVAWKGELLSGYAVETLAGPPDANGAATVERSHRSSGLRTMAARAAKELGLSGFFALDCVVDGPGARPTLTGLGRALRAETHRGSAHGVDPCKALFAAINGLASTTRTDFDEGEERISVDFPREWLRDPDSPWLRDHPVDLPWEEPELIEAMIALRN